MAQRAEQQTAETRQSRRHGLGGDPRPAGVRGEPAEAAHAVARAARAPIPPPVRVFNLVDDVPGRRTPAAPARG